MTDLPIDPTTPLGQTRLMVGDVTFDITTGTYTYFTDAEVNACILLASGSVLRACGYLVLQLANSQTLAGLSIKADQFSIATTGKGGTLVQVAQQYFAQADVADMNSQAEDADGIAIVQLAPQAPENITPNAWVDNWAGQWRFLEP